jgi:hypothetical protein
MNLNSYVFMKKSASFSDQMLPPEAIREELERILASEDFVKSRQLGRFLEYLVEKSLKGQAEELKEGRLAIDLLNRTMDFDLQIDPLVRVLANRVRRALERYYLSDGKNDPLRIELPQDYYVPTFHIL